MFAPLTPFEVEALLLSLRVGAASLLVTAPLGIALAWLLARGRFPGKWLLEALVNLPLVLPPVVTGYLLLLAFGRRGTFGAALAEIGIVFSFRWTGAALACAVMGFPLMVRAMRLSLEAVDARVEQAAAARAATVPARRIGQPDEFGAACAFLCSSHAGFITGQNLLMDGGIFPGAF